MSEQVMIEPAMLNRLIQLFYSKQELLGTFLQKTKFELPSDYRRLLAHEEHMTVTVEAFHGCAVEVEVLQAIWNEPIYSRKILLRRTKDNAVVQFGLVCLDTSVLDPAIRDAVLEGKTPLGRILIQNDVLRKVQLEALWEVHCGSELSSHFGHPSAVTYGRTARILFGDIPALELLEIVYVPSIDRI